MDAGRACHGGDKYEDHSRRGLFRSVDTNRRSPVPALGEGSDGQVFASGSNKLPRKLEDPLGVSSDQAILVLSVVQPLTYVGQTKHFR